MREYYYLSAQGYLIMYSVTSRSTFEEVPLKHESILRVKGTSHYPVVLVGNKIDAEGARQVSQLEGLRLAGLMGCPFFETSAKLRVNVEEVFLELVNEIRRMQEPEIQHTVWKYKLNKVNKNKIYGNKLLLPKFQENLQIRVIFEKGSFQILQNCLLCFLFCNC